MADIDWLTSVAGALGLGALLPAALKAVNDRRKDSANAVVDEQKAVGIATNNYLTVMRELGAMNTKLSECMALHREAARDLQECKDARATILASFEALQARQRRAGKVLAAEDEA